MSRRCLCEFLYRQLELMAEADEKKLPAEECIFQERPCGKGYKLKVGREDGSDKRALYRVCSVS